jgi:hypothetical protein
MLMDRMGLIIPSIEQIHQVESTALTEAEYEADLAIARAVGCVVLHSDNDVLNEQHIAIYPETGSTTVWWRGKVMVKAEADSLVSTSQVPGIGRNDGLAFGGIYRRPDSHMSFLRRYQHQYALAEDIQPGDMVALRDGSERQYRSYTIRTVEQPES